MQKINNKPYYFLYLGILLGFFLFGAFMGPLSFSKSFFSTQNSALTYSEDLQGGRTQIQQKMAIEAMIQRLAANIHPYRRRKLAYKIYDESRKYKIDARLIVSIIATESDFQKDPRSYTGDISLAQINPRVWVKEFRRLGRKNLNKSLLKHSEFYALERMLEILSILKGRYERSDPHWFSYYHSSTAKYRKKYQQKVLQRVDLVSNVDYRELTKYKSN